LRYEDQSASLLKDAGPRATQRNVQKALLEENLEAEASFRELSQQEAES
jgi:hypothetical protein